MSSSQSCPGRPQSRRNALPAVALRSLLLCATVLGASCAQPRSSGSAPSSASETPRSRPAAERARAAALAPLLALRVASWNLEWLHREDGAGPVPRQAGDYERLRSYAERLAADVVAVQEVYGAEALQRVFTSERYQLELAHESGNQLGGFAIRKGLEVTRHPDLVALNTTGGLRSGVDVTVRINGTRLRLLGVHLKSGCFDAPLQGTQSSCQKLRAQLPRLEQWIDARAAEGEPFAVLGDFNRHLRSGEAFYSELDDGNPPNADLTLVTEGKQSSCWGGEHPEFIDHIALSRNAAPWLVDGSFAQQLFDAADTPHRKHLSDHCPISIVLKPGLAGSPPPPVVVPPVASVGPIKGNISSKGKKLYHAPGCPQYERVQIDEAKGERRFASEAQALAAGWNKAPGCP